MYFEGYKEQTLTTISNSTVNKNTKARISC
jgi:hypothetical protein